MNRSTTKRNLLSVIIALFCINFLHGMNESQLTSPENHERDLRQLNKAVDYNHNNPLLLLPLEILNTIFFFCQADECGYPAFKENIVNFVNLSAASKNLNTLITVPMIGNFCKNQSGKIKIAMLDDFIIKKIRRIYQKGNYQISQIPLMFAQGAQIKIKNIHLFKDALENDDIILIEILLEHGKYSDESDSDESNFDENYYPNYRTNNPMIFYAQSIKAAELLINNGAYIHAEGEHYPNILGHIIHHHYKYKSELIKFYLNCDVNPNVLHNLNNKSLLHELAIHRTDHNINEFLKIAELIINTIPDMINHKNSFEQTPLDLAYLTLGATYKWGEYQYIDATKKLIELFKKYGAVTKTESAYMHYWCNLF